MKKWTLVSTLGLSLLLTPLTAHYASANDLPNIGTAAVTSLNYNQEKLLGDLYTRIIRGSTNFSSDPVSLYYLNNLGNRLVKNTPSANMPFQFHLINNDTINAFAYFGGHVVVHSRLILTTENESELASVMSHEIGHVTQRHLARQIEDRRLSNPLTWGGILGGILVGALNPEGGMAILTGTLAGSAQGQLSFSQSNEREADRVGLQTLAKAGFDPSASYSFLQKLDDQSRYSSEKVFAMLSTHPNPGSRVSDVRNRALSYGKKNVASSLDYSLLKVRVALNAYPNNPFNQVVLSKLANSTAPNDKIATQYALAFAAYKKGQFSQAEQILTQLLRSHPNNLWFIDLMSDVEISSGKSDKAITRLESALSRQRNHPVLQLNLANAYLKNRNYSKAITLLNRYTVQNPDDINGWDLLVTANNGIKNRPEAMLAQSEIYALEGDIDSAIQMLERNLNLAPKSSLTYQKMVAKVDYYKKLQNRFKELRKSL